MGARLVCWVRGLEAQACLMTLPAHRFDTRKKSDVDLDQFIQDNDAHGVNIPDIDIWKSLKKDKDFQAASRYVNLILPGQANEIMDAISKQDPEWFRADDLLRACRLDAAPPQDPTTRQQLLRLIQGEKFVYPQLLNVGNRLDLIDGYHRVCVAYLLHPQFPVPVVRVTA